MADIQQSDHLDDAEKEVRIPPPVCVLHGLLPVVLAFVAESSLVWLWHIGALNMLMIGISHLLASLLPLVTVRDCGKEGLDERLAWLGSLTVLFLGPIGALGTIWASLSYYRYRKNARPFDDWYRSILPTQNISRSERLIERLKAWGRESENSTHGEPVPFNELISMGSRSDKQLAIAMMARNYNSAFAPAFKQALADEDNAVRVQAASAITRIEDQYHQTAMRLEQQVKRRGNHKNYKALAEHYDHHANAGLTDDDSIKELRTKARKAYEAALDKQPKDYSTLWLLGRLLVRMREIKQASTVYEQAFKLNSQAKVTDRVWYWECLYREKRYPELRTQVETYFESLPEDIYLPPTLLDTLRLWAPNKKSVELSAHG